MCLYYSLLFSSPQQFSGVLINPDTSGGVSGSVWPNSNMITILRKGG